MASQPPTAQEIQLHIGNQALKGRIAQLEAEVTAVNTKVAADAVTIATLQAQLAESEEEAASWKAKYRAVAPVLTWQSFQFSTSDAAKWGGYAFTAEDAYEWRQRAFTAGDAYEWRQRAFTAKGAYQWRQAGFDAEKAYQRRQMGLTPRN